MMRKKIILAACTGLLCAVSAVPAYAGVWKKGTADNTDRWWYDNENGSWAAAQWKWIDGNSDGTAECYFFDESGWLLTDTVTPDGYTVNADGAWTVDGIIQTRQIKSVNDNSDDQSWEDFQNEDDEDEEDSSEKKSSSEPTFDSSSEENSTPQGPALESDSSSSGNGDEKPDYEYPTETPDSSYKHSSAE